MFSWERIARVGEATAGRAAQAAGVGAARALEPLAAALQHELAAKLTATDHLLRDNIEKLANSKVRALQVQRQCGATGAKLNTTDHLLAKKRTFKLSYYWFRGRGGSSKYHAWSQE